MKSTYLLILAFLVVCNLTVCGGQGIPAEDEADGRTIDEIILQRAESLLLRSILKKIQDEDGRNEGSSSQAEWVTKRQHPGKRYGEDVEKRQHPGRREDPGRREEDEDEQYQDVQKRQHPGRREEDEDEQYQDVQKRQHPGRREDEGREEETHSFMEFQKRQHPGKRYLMVHSKRQHPGKRDGDEDEDEDEDGDLEKRQHPGKRFWDFSNPDFGTNSPCDVLDPTSCSKTSLLRDFLDNMNKSQAEEKRQHPGKRFAPEEDLVEEK
ncbi:pro-thyrotropin-releasing hormone [Anoplopoma fimbria]|uniref:pro-thyrotropin-releasing hormone n=1 Tax=Anoplopoma fimbria TaxID=229290 RepID=UPI0023EDE178|nr:pro-thyrotropin-releasing hormone [Anoplopoma fimbria]